MPYIGRMAQVHPEMLEDFNETPEIAQKRDENSVTEIIHRGQFILAAAVNIVFILTICYIFPQIFGPETAREAFKDQYEYIFYYLLVIVLGFSYYIRRIVMLLPYAGLLSILIWIVIYFTVFFRTFIMEFQQVNNCNVTEVDSFYVPQGTTHSEYYTVLSVNFEHENQVYQGYACKSNHKHKKTLLSSPKPYEFIQKGEFITTSQNSSGSGRYIDIQYNDSEIKIQAWQCTDHNEILANHYDTCYMKIYGDSSLAKQNGVNKNMNVKNMKDFFLVKLNEDTPFYNKELFEEVFSFGFFPFYFSGILIFGYLAINKSERSIQILEKLTKISKKHQQSIALFFELNKIYTSYGNKLGKDKLDDKISYYNKALNIDSLYQKAYLLKGITLKQQNKVFDSLQCFYIAARINRKQLSYIQDKDLQKYAVYYYTQTQSQLFSLLKLKQQYETKYRQEIVQEMGDYLQINDPVKKENKALQKLNQV